MTRKFSEVLEEYLEERDRRLNGDYRNASSFLRLHDLAKELDEMIEGVEE